MVEHINFIVDLGFIEFTGALMRKYILSIMIINVNCDVIFFPHRMKYNIDVETYEPNNEGFIT